MEKKNIKRIFSLGFPWETQDPFLFCVHHEDFYPKGNGNLGPISSLEGRNLGNDFTIKDGFRMYHGKQVPGFPGHPHRGFETITVVRKGFVDHADSAGGAGRYGNGDVQWMTAGKGLQHSEMFPLLNSDKDNPLELFQIWINLPKKSKFVEPTFKMLWAEDQAVEYFTDDNSVKTKIEVVTGAIKKTTTSPPKDSWAADASNQVAIWNITIQANGKFILPKAQTGLNRTIYFHEGDKITVDGIEIDKYKGVDLRSDVDIALKNGNAEARILMLQGKPINEKVVQYGPFVMNSQEEIEQAMIDYQRTQFGGWPWDKNDPTHGTTLKRFAKYPDGTSEEK